MEELNHDLASIQNERERERERERYEDERFHIFEKWCTKYNEPGCVWNSASFMKFLFANDYNALLN